MLYMLYMLYMLCLIKYKSKVKWNYRLHVNLTLKEKLLRFHLIIIRAYNKKYNFLFSFNNYFVQL